MRLKRYVPIFLMSASLVSLRAQALPASAAADPTKVVATIAGKDITAADVLKMLASFDAPSTQAFQQNPQNVLSQYFLFVHLAEEADKAKLLEKSPYKEQFEGLKLQVLQRARINEENNSFPVTPDMIEAYYKEHGSQYEQAKIKAIYITYAGQLPVVGTGPDAMKAAAQNALQSTAGKRSEAEARTIAEDIVKQLRAGVDFAKLAEKYSEDATSKAAGGDFGIIKAVSDYPADFKNAVFALKAGEISAPIRQPIAFYVVRLEEKSSQPLDEVRGPIVQALRNDHMNQWAKELSAAYQATIKDSDFFRTFTAQPFPGPLAAPPPAPSK